MLIDVTKRTEDERKERKHAEAKFIEVRERLRRAERANAQLVEHVQSQVSRLRDSRRELATLRVKSAIEQVCIELIGQAQTSLSRAWEYFAEQRECQRLNSFASQVKTQLDMIAMFGIEISPEEEIEIQVRYDGYAKDIKEMHLIDFSNREYEFAPEPSVLPKSYVDGHISSPLRGDFEIESHWVLEPYQSIEVEDAEDDDDTAQSSDQTVQLEQHPEALLTAMTSKSSRSVKLIDQFVSSIILKVTEDLMDEIADRVLNESAPSDQVMTKVSAKD